MRQIETEIYEAVPDKPGCVRVIGKKKTKKIFNELVEKLKEKRLLPEEYFLLDKDMPEEFPEVHDIICHPNWGGSEGIYMDIYIIADSNTKRSTIHFATGKTLDESVDSFERMNYAAGYIYRLFMGEGITGARYYAVRKETPEVQRKRLYECVNMEFRNLMKEYLFCDLEMQKISVEQIALKALIRRALDTCQLSDEKVEQLLRGEDILEQLYKLCKSEETLRNSEIEAVLLS